MALVNKKFQELITFSRASSGTYVNSSGYITNNDTVTNYLTYSGAFDNANWTKSNTNIQTNLTAYSQTFNTGWGPNNIQAFGSGSIADAIVAPDGTLTADLISNAAAAGLDFHYVAQGINLFQNTTYTLSVYAKAGPVGSGIIWLLGNAASDIFCYFNLTTGAVGTTTNFISASIQNVGGGWYRCVASFTNTAVTGSQAIGFGLAQVDGTPNWNSVGLAGTQQAYLWGAQLVFGTVPGDYQVTAGTAINVLYPDYNGVRRARKLCENNATNFHTTYQGVTPAVYTASVYAKAGERTFVQLASGVSGNHYVTFDLINGTISQQGSSVISASITSVGNGWYRVIATMASSSVAPFITICQTGTGAWLPSYTGDGSSGIYIADAQLVAGTLVTDYWENDTGTVPYAPRFDYNPVTLGLRGVLFEGQRTNLLLYSDQFDNASAWALVNATITANTGVSPDGTVSADTLTSSGAAVIQRITQSVAQTGILTASIYAKAGTAQFLQILHASDGNCFANFNLVTGTVGTVGTGSTATILPAGNGWYRCCLTFNITIASNWQFYIAPSASASYGQIFTATVASFSLWGAQVEAGDGASTYIPTAASQVTRATDFGSVNDLAPWFTRSQGTYYVEFDLVYNSGGSNLAQIAMSSKTGYSTGNGMLVRAAPPVSVQYGGNTSALTIAGLNINPTVTVKVAATFQGVNAKFCANGGAVSTMATMDFTGVGTVALLFAQLNTGGLQQGFTHLRRVTYYPAVLSDTQLQSITA